MARYQRGKSNEGTKNRTEVASDELEKDIMELWESMANSDLNEWKKPWVLNAFHGENAGQFVNGGDRYRYKGGFNQYLVARHTDHLESKMGPLVAAQSEITKMFGVESFVDTPVVKNGIKSVGSLFMAPMQVKTVSWENADGTRWKGEDKTPTAKQIKEEGLQKVEGSFQVYKTFPVWSMHDLYEHLPDDKKAKVDELVEIRSRTGGYDFDPSDKIETLIDAKLSDVLDRQSIPVRTGTNSAYYRPMIDDITLPAKSQFRNPVSYFAVTMHELAHSTMHLTERKWGAAGSKDYAVEEIIAETTATMMVKKLERELEPHMDQRPDIKEMFRDHYDNAMAYNKSWGHDVDFIDQVRLVAESKENGDKGIVKKIMVAVAKAVEELSENEHTPEDRKEALVKNVAQYHVKKDKSYEPEMAMG